MDTKDGRRDTDRPLRAVALMLVAGAVLVLNDAAVKALANDLAVGQVLALRGMVIFLPIMILAHRTGGVMTMFMIKSWPGQFIRGFCVVGASFFFVHGLRYLSLSDNITIAFAGPLFVTMMAPFFLGEKIGWRRWSAVIVGFVGVLIIMRPTTAAFQLAALLPLAASMMSSLRDVVTRRLSATESSAAVLFVTTLSVVIAGLATWPFTDWVTIGWGHVPFLLASGFLNGFGNYLAIEAFRQGEAALVSPFKYFNVVWACLFGYLMFGEIPDTYTIFGAIVVAGSGVYILHREARRKSHPGPGK